MSLKAICPVKASTKALKVQMNGRVSQVVKKKKINSKRLVGTKTKGKWRTKEEGTRKIGLKRDCR